MPVSQPSTGSTAATPSWTVGDLVVHRIDEVKLPPQTGAWLLPAATPDVVGQVPWLTPSFADDEGTLHLASHSFALKVNGLRALIDTGIGNGKTRANPAWHNLDTDYLQRLIDAGFAPETVDLVILTHLHTDHVGWNTREVNGEWVPTFTNARYITSTTEWDYWAGVDLEEPRRQMFRDSIYPIRDAGLLSLVEVPRSTAAGGSGIEVAPGIRLFATPGHTPGHVAVELADAGESAVITGDLIHHPVQLPHPHITSRVDIDAPLAAATRRDLMSALVGSDVLVLGSHFPPPTAGRIAFTEHDYRLVPTPSSDVTA
ncbi:MBL fold metallo-hydrolase [Streptomyces sp. NPDC098781]|uniref:MBL fold metallo-hydrolase n=1 Tax=Streptomyces sp. NPDC098781 TaxID=3366097 RepID=UPI00382FC1C4